MIALYRFNTEKRAPALQNRFWFRKFSKPQQRRLCLGQGLESHNGKERALLIKSMDVYGNPPLLVGTLDPKMLKL